jgi:hypothetical protein
VDVENKEGVGVEMRPLRDCDTLQIEITNVCQNQCSNCTRLIGHHPNPYFMGMEDVQRAVNSLVDFPRMTGIMGGEPLLHPDFIEICEYLHSKIPPIRCGLWTSFPEGKEHYREIIVKTFGHIFLNDHTRDDVQHCPVLVSAEEVWKQDTYHMWYLIEHCWVQEGWSASINPKGAFFCEVAGALSMLLGENEAWPVEPGWWKRTPKDFVKQMETYCPRCGCAMPLGSRKSTDGVDDISPCMLERIKEISPKVKHGKYEIHNLKLNLNQEPMATYKDEQYRKEIAARYGMFLMNNTVGFQTPYLKKDWKQ